MQFVHCIACDSKRYIRYTYSNYTSTIYNIPPLSRVKKRGRIHQDWAHRLSDRFSVAFLPFISFIVEQAVIMECIDPEVVECAGFVVEVFQTLWMSC